MALYPESWAVQEIDGGLGLHHLSYSSLSEFAECPYKWFLHYVVRDLRPVGWRLTVGSGGHLALETNNNHFIDKGEYYHGRELDALTAWGFDEAFKREEEGTGCDLEGFDEDQSRKKLVKTVSIYHREFGKNVIPDKVEDRYSFPLLELDGRTIDFVGRVDLKAVAGNVGEIIDYKFSSKKRSHQAPDMQGSLYVAAAPPEDNIKAFSYHTLVATGGKEDYQVLPIPQVHDYAQWAKAWAIRMARHIQSLLDAINGEPTSENFGEFLPTPKMKAGQWYCGPGRCQYADVCFGFGMGKEFHNI